MSLHLDKNCLKILYCLYNKRFLRMPYKTLYYLLPNYCFISISQHSLHVGLLIVHTLNHTTTFPSGFKTELRHLLFWESFNLLDIKLVNVTKITVCIYFFLLYSCNIKNNLSHNKPQNFDIVYGSHPF